MSLRGSLCAITLLGLTLAAPPRAAAQLPDFSNFGGGAVRREEQVAVRAQFSTPTDKRPALVFVTATIVPDFHMYAIDQAPGGPQPTVVRIVGTEQVKQLGPFQPIKPPQTHVDELAWKGLEIREHEGEVTWFAPIEIAAGVDLAKLQIEGTINGQACSDKAGVCVDISDKKFVAERGPGVALPADLQIRLDAGGDSAAAPAANGAGAALPEGPDSTPIMRSAAGTAPAAGVSGPAAAGELYDINQIRLRKSSGGSLAYYLITAFLGGLILNIMPCVLPVIGLKIMSFVQQAGESRRRALLLNVWYSAGIVAVFLALGAMAVTLQVGWGDQFGNSWFLITLTAVVFAMALSLLGLWEIPIPGFVGSSAVMEAARREGPSAALLKGALTTILATPCTGPYMVSGVAWAVKQPPYVTLAVFAALGIGMASPYLLVGAFPSLIKFLPKPGAWMETFKKAMGLVLLATVVWLLSTVDPPLVIPTIALFVGITVACWWTSQTSVSATAREQARGWVQALTIIAATAVVAFAWLYPDVTGPRFERRLEDFADRKVAESQMETAHRLAGVASDADLAHVIEDLAANISYDGDEPWQSFTLPKLGRLTLGERRTVLVDFTADWCVSCKVFEKTVLKTEDVTQALDNADVVTMTADYTKKPAWMGQTIKALGGIGVPVIAIFPADRPYEPIVFSGGYTKSGLLEAIAKATGGRTETKTARAGVAAASER
jgi:thiol:disulfide interchange protein DsbD